MPQAEDVVNFTANLKLLCSYYKSTSEVCRKININRQQFNRYLNGTTFPAYGNLQRICDFFGVDQEEILLANTQFKKKISPVASESSQPISSELIKQLEVLKNISTGNLDRYLGYYYRYIYSGAFPKKILKSLIRIYKKDDSYYTWHIERVNSELGIKGSSIVIRYNGVAYMLAERIYLVEVESKMKSNLSETILTPNYLANSKSLSGISCYSAPDFSHRPVAVRVFNEYIGEDINIKKALKRCSLYSNDTDQISDRIKENISIKASELDNLITSKI